MRTPEQDSEVTRLFREFDHIVAQLAMLGVDVWKVRGPEPPEPLRIDAGDKDLAFYDFTRDPQEHETVECLVDLGLAELRLWSDRATGYREWEVDEVTVRGSRYGAPAVTLELAPREKRQLPHGDLRARIDREFTKWLAGEGRQPPPYNAMRIEEDHESSA